MGRYMYSNSRPMTPEMMVSPLLARDAMQSQLNKDLGYIQADEKGRRRMEANYRMGFPLNTDPNKIEKVGYDPTRGPIYRAPKPLPWGTWGSFGGGKERNEPVPTPQPPEGGGGPQPAQGTGAPFTAPERSLGTSASSPLAFTGFGRTIGESAYRTPTIPPTVPSPISRGTTETLTGFGGVPRFPFAGY